MKKGFSILELLVASLLLGMLITILTMVFNQSSIAWRTGVATVADLDQVRDNVGTAREEADDIYIWRDDALKLLSLWDEKGALRARAVSVDDEADEKPTYFPGKGRRFTSSTRQESFKLIDVGSGDSGGSIDTYIINIKSAGPNKQFGDYDDIWSSPDEFEME